jgi:gliding motility-associated-like protein
LLSLQKGYSFAFQLLFTTYILLLNILAKSCSVLTFVTILAISISFNLQAQTTATKIWDKAFGGSNFEALTSMQQTTDGGYILGGISNSGQSFDKSQNSKGMEDYWIVRLDASGTKIWDKTFGGNNAEWFYDLKQTSDGGYILGGVSQSPQSGDKSQGIKGQYDFWILKLDNAGNKVWDKTFGSLKEDRFVSLHQTSDGGYLLAGNSGAGISGDKSQPTKGKEDFWLIKINSAGNKVWDKGFGGDSDDILWDVLPTSDGGFILGGSSSSGQNGDKSQPSKGKVDYWLIKTDANGNKIWDSSFGGIDADELISIDQTADKGFILGGFSYSNVSGDKSFPNKGNIGTSDFWVIKIDSTGKKIWDKTYGGNQNDELLSLIQTTDKGYLVAGTSYSEKSGDKSDSVNGLTDYWILKIDSIGNTKWDKQFGGDDREFLTTMSKCRNNEVLLGGYSFSGQSGNKSQASKGDSDFWIVNLKLESSATQPPINDPSNNDPATNEQEALNELKFPNIITPDNDGFNDSFKITNLNKFPKSEIYIFNCWGNCVFSNTDYKGDWKAEGLSSGVYYYKFKTSKGQIFNGWIDVVH